MKSHSIIIAVVIVLVFVGLYANTAMALPGSGTQEDPYRIQSLADFDEFAADPNYWSGFTLLETDVNLAGRNYSTAVIAPDIDNSNNYFDGTAFTGVFDGNDHKIVLLTIDDGGAGNDYLGLFGYIYGGEFRNLVLEAVSVSGDLFVGGLVGANGDWYNPRGTISNCYSSGNVRGNDGVGGLVGANGGSISNCYSTGNVSGTWSVGGLVGYKDGGSISNCYSIGDVSGVGGVGGLVGSNGGSVSDCYSSGNVRGNDGVGGLVGANGVSCYEGGTIWNCYSTGDVNGLRNVGGLVGLNGLSPDEWCRFCRGYIFNSYSIGNINGIDDVGGLVGYNNYGFVDRSFWDVQTSGEPNMCGSHDILGTVCDPNCGKTTAEMKTMSTFTDAGWDFIEIWGIGEHQTYPYLRTEPSGDSNHDGKVDLVDFAIIADHWLEGIDN